MTSDKLYDWMAQNNVKPAKMAELLGVDSRSLSTYKSRGLPKAKQILAQKIMSEWNKPVIQATGLLVTAKLETDEQKQHWEQANLIKDNQFTEFAIQRLNQLAANIAEFDDLAYRKQAEQILLAEDSPNYSSGDKSQGQAG